MEGLGLIPAHAGSTSQITQVESHGWAHPRSRGEHQELKPTRSPVTGSSPLTRGALEQNAVVVGTEGLIPAHAGSTGGGHFCVSRPGAHPRSRGEHFINASVIDLCLGSSPLTRGAPCQLYPTNSQRGLIPAHAGSTVLGPRLGFRWWAHPRSRGEHPPRTAGEVAVHNKEGQLVAQDDVTPLTRGGEPIA